MGHRNQGVIADTFRVRCGTRVVDKFQTKQQKLEQRAAKAQKDKALRDRCAGK
jgi:hypothetical protein